MALRHQTLYRLEGTSPLQKLRASFDISSHDWHIAKAKADIHDGVWTRRSDQSRTHVVTTLNALATICSCIVFKAPPETLS